MTTDHAAAATRLREHALSLPEAWEDFPWGESVAKVRKKVFVFFGRPEDKSLGLSVKLPASAAEALELPNASPTGYGLGKAGWVSLTWSEGEEVPVDRLLDWIEESYCAVAPKTLARKLA